VEDSKDLMKRVAALLPGTEVKMTVLRDGEKKEITVELGERPKPVELAEGKTPATVYDLGMEVRDLTEDLTDRLGLDTTDGVVVAEVRRGSPAAREGIEPGMVIIKVNRQEVTNTKEFYNEIGKIEKGETVVLLITDGQHRRFVELRIPDED
jgi:serine protease Do